MADTKITALTALTAADPANDVIPIVDVSDTTMAASGTTKKISVNNILSSSPTASGALTVTGLVTAGSATITGDLTVDTSTLKVDSANNRVGIGTASPTAGMALDIVSATSNNFVRFTDGVNATGYLGIRAASGAAYLHGNNNVVSLSCSTSNTTPTEQLRITNPGVFEFLDGAGGTRMTLNSTGLGVGVASPTQKLHVKGVVNFEQVSGGTNGWQVYTYTDGTYRMNYNGAGADELIIDSSGNVGIGVTPSAWVTLRGLQNGRANLVGYVSNSEGAWLTNNAFYDGSWKYQTSAQASHYQQLSGVHCWTIAATGTAGNAITFTQAMTLDASGNLLVAKTASGFNVAGAEIRSNGEVLQTIAASTDATIVSKVYSSTAAAYRFYVGLGGTVFATNTTISAISDARLKENVQDIDVGLGAILALKPRKFDWKEGKGKNIKGDRGFIAQEFEQVFPQLVDKWADESPEGETPYKSIRQDLIPVLVKAIQELAARVQTLETR